MSLIYIYLLLAVYKYKNMDGAFCIQILICNVFMMGPELRIQMKWLFKMVGDSRL